MHSYTVSFNHRGEEIDTHVSVFNEGPQILALHGLGRNGEGGFSELESYLQDYQIVAPDWIGFGEASKPLREKEDYGSEYCAEWFLNFVKTSQNTGILKENFHILAKSMSGIPVAETYKNISDSVNKMIFVNPAGIDEKISKPYSFALTSGIVNTKSARLATSNAVWGFLRKSTKYDWPEEEKQRLIKDLEGDGKELQVLLRYAKAGIHPWGRMKKETHIVPEAYDEIDSSVMILASKQDSVFTEQRYLEYAEERGWKTEIIDYDKHNVLIGKPRECAERIREFL